MPPRELDLQDADKLSIAQTVFGEGAGADADFQKMVIQTILNRYLSGRTQEFGDSIQDIAYKGYEAVKNPNDPYKLITSGEPLDPSSAQSFGQIKTLLEAIIADKDYGKSMFYFKPEEEEGLRAKGQKAFNFDLVNPTGMVGDYRTYGYK